MKVIKKTIRRRDSFIINIVNHRISQRICQRDYITVNFGIIKTLECQLQDQECLQFYSLILFEPNIPNLQRRKILIHPLSGVRRES